MSKNIIEVLFVWPNERACKSQWDYSDKDQRRTLGMEISSCLEMGGIVCSCRNRYGMLSALEQAVRDNADLIG